jgi:SAM-dependent methyltransferase
MGLRGLAARALDGVWRVSREARLTLLRRAAGAQIQRPNSPAEWSALYPDRAETVKEIQNPIARAVADLTRAGDVLLEAGCGHARLSAELALAGRVIELCDFSPEILERAAALFRRSGLPPPALTLADITQPLPWPDRSVDWVWSSGVLEHWTDEELGPILREMARISREGVISLVPNARSVFYRLAKHLMEDAGLWPYGRELPRATLKPVFEAAGLQSIREFTIVPEEGLPLLRHTDPGIYGLVSNWWSNLAPDDPLLQDQGYLLVTVGLKSPSSPLGSSHASIRR